MNISLLPSSFASKLPRASSRWLRGPLVLGLALTFAVALRAETFVIVHGAWGGGWQWKKVDELLSARGHKVYRPTLTGLGERVHLAHAGINLSTHVDDVANVLIWEDLHDAVLIAHSYGGMVATGVMDRVPERIKRVVFVDALAPEDGESLRTALGDRALPGKTTGDFVVPDWVRPGKPIPYDVPQPVKTLEEPVSFRNPAALRIPGTFILTVDAGRKPEEDAFFKFAERARVRGWTVVTMEADHNPEWRKPAELAPLLEAAAAR